MVLGCVSGVAVHAGQFRFSRGDPCDSGNQGAPECHDHVAADCCITWVPRDL